MELALWHPESPGVKVRVKRNWFQRLVLNKDFATLNECLKASEY